MYLEETHSPQSFSQYTRLLYLSGDKGDQWNKATIRLGRISKSFKFSFDAWRSFSTTDDLAIDDIRMKNCQFPEPRPQGCPSAYFTCARQACISESRVCDLTDDCGDGSDELNCSKYTQCDFENGLCDWKNGYGDLEWTRGRGATSSLDTGPSRDHTTGTAEGYYIYLEASNTAGSKAQIVSSVVKTSISGNCNFRFFYHMYGKDIGSLNVYVKTMNGLKSIFSRETEVGDYWERVNLDLSAEPLPFQLVIEGKLKNL